MKVTVKH
jgi:hypothetical protein